MLTFNLKKEWFEKIKSGVKMHEYREVKPYWEKRFLKRFRNDQLYKQLTGCRGCRICFVLGYTKQRIYANIESIRIINGKNTDLAIDKEVYDIEFKIEEQNNEKRKKNRKTMEQIS